MLGAPGQRWLTAQGPYDGNTATLIIEFVDCLKALASYEITSPDIAGEIVVQRVVLENVSLYEMLADP